MSEEQENTSLAADVAEAAEQVENKGVPEVTGSIDEAITQYDTDLKELTNAQIAALGPGNFKPETDDDEVQDRAQAEGHDDAASEADSQPASATIVIGDVMVELLADGIPKDASVVGNGKDFVLVRSGLRIYGRYEGESNPVAYVSTKPREGAIYPTLPADAPVGDTDSKGAGEGS